MKTVTSLSDIPGGEHWAIIRTVSVTIPGDERSRTAPGHGYPEHTQKYVEYVAYTTEEEFKIDLEHHLRNLYSNPCVGIHVHGKYTSKMIFELTPPK